MKYFLSLLLFTGIIHAAMAQDGVSSARLRDVQTLPLRGQQLTIDNQTFDYRVLKYYSESQLREMSAEKRAQLNYIYTESYKVLDIDKCSNLSLIDIDVAKLEIDRDANATKVVEFGIDCKVKVELVSRNAIEQKMAQLSKQ